MNFIKRITSRFTARGRALAQIELGMSSAKNRNSDLAIKHYTDVLNLSETPRDVKAMALFNRALVYASIEKEKLASDDLKAVIAMPETFEKIKKSASDKLVRMSRKSAREATAKDEA
jgi:hypothetical protein